jgi:hypothetical protein
MLIYCRCNIYMRAILALEPLGYGCKILLCNVIADDASVRYVFMQHVLVRTAYRGILIF